jgi:hypothetical protein
MTILYPVLLLEQDLDLKREREILHYLSGLNPLLCFHMQEKPLPMKVKHSCYRCGERENTRFSPESTFPYAVLGSLKAIDDYVVIVLRIRILQDASKSVTSQEGLLQ